MYICIFLKKEEINIFRPVNNFGLCLTLLSVVGLIVDMLVLFFAVESSFVFVYSQGVDNLNGLPLPRKHFMKGHGLVQC